MPRLVEAVIEIMGDAYPELRTNQDLIADTVEREEHAFRRTLASGTAQLETEIAGLEPGTALDGETAFKLHDTYGFPIDVTAEILAERGLTLDRDGFETEMDHQRKRSRVAYKGGDAAARQEVYISLLRHIDGTDFVGYDGEATVGRALSIVRDGETIERASTGEPVEVFVDTTPFYAESGEIGRASCRERV